MTSTGLTIYAGPAGDHNDRAMEAVGLVGTAMARLLKVEPTVIGRPVPSDPQSWEIELDRARGSLQEMAARVDAVLSDGQLPVSAITRCAVALAVQPVIARHRPDAVVVWLDAHADIQVPDQTETGFLGGLALSGPLGWWESGFGSGVAQAILVGSRDLDRAEAEQVRSGRIEVVEVGPDLGDRLAAAVAGRPVSFHLDCDVLEPGVVRTDYQVPGGLSLDDLRECAEIIARNEVVGVEVAEFEGTGRATAEELIEALSPLFGS